MGMLQMIPGCDKQALRVRASGFGGLNNNCGTVFSGTAGKHVQGYFGYETLPPVETCSIICLGPYGGPREGAVSYERSNPPQDLTVAYA